MYFVGLDVHARCSSLCIVDHAGRSVKRLEVRGAWPKLMDEVAASVPRPIAVCYEASCGYGYLHERLSRLAERVAVAHPGKLRLIYGDKRKNDRVDAQKLAKLLCLDAVPGGARAAGGRAGVARADRGASAAGRPPRGGEGQVAGSAPRGRDLRRGRPGRQTAVERQGPRVARRRPAVPGRRAAA